MHFGGGLGPIGLLEKTVRPHKMAGWRSIGEVDAVSGKNHHPWYDVWCGHEAQHVPEIKKLLQQACDMIGHYYAEVEEYE